MIWRPQTAQSMMPHRSQGQKNQACPLQSHRMPQDWKNRSILSMHFKSQNWSYKLLVGSNQIRLDRYHRREAILSTSIPRRSRSSHLLSILTTPPILVTRNLVGLFQIIVQLLLSHSLIRAFSFLRVRYQSLPPWVAAVSQVTIGFMMLRRTTFHMLRTSYGNPARSISSSILIVARRSVRNSLGMVIRYLYSRTVFISKIRGIVTYFVCNVACAVVANRRLTWGHTGSW